MPLAVNDIVQVTVEGRKDGQVLMNVFYYRVTAAPSTGTVADNITGFLNHLWAVDAGVLETLWTLVMPDDYTLQLARGQKIAPTREAYVEVLLVDGGDIDVNPIETANLAWVFVKQTEFAGRRGRGTTHMLLPTMDWVTNGELNNEGASQRVGIATEIANTQVPASGGTFEPVIYHPGFSPVAHRITHCTIKQEIRVMRRRTVRFGI